MDPSEIKDQIERTLLDDWQDRRRRLSAEGGRSEQLAELQVQILDYLIHRYGDSPEARRPARFSPKSALLVNERAIVVHHHLGRGKFGGVKSRQEAEQRVSAVLGRMTSAARRATSGEVPAGEERPDDDWFDSMEPECTDSTIWAPAVQSLRSRRRDHRAIAEALQFSAIAPRAVLQYLYECLADPEFEDLLALDLLALCENSRAVNYAVLAFRERLEAGLRDVVIENMRQYFTCEDVRDRAVEPICDLLAADHGAVRMEAIGLLGSIGTLDDVGLLSDLLSLPPLHDEVPGEREAMVRAMQQISHAE